MPRPSYLLKTKQNVDLQFKRLHISVLLSEAECFCCRCEESSVPERMNRSGSQEQNVFFKKIVFSQKCL
jgi:hypothetical protein